MSKKFKFTHEDLDNMILESLDEDTDSAEAKKSKPNLIQRLLGEARLKVSKESE